MIKKGRATLRINIVKRRPPPPPPPGDAACLFLREKASVHADYDDDDGDNENC